MPEVNFNLLAPSADLYSGPQVQMDPVAAYEKAKATRQSNMLAQLYAKHYDPQTGGVNYNALIGEAAQSGLDVPKLMGEAQNQAQAQAELSRTHAQQKQYEAETKQKEAEIKQKEAAARHEDINRAIRDISAYTNKPAAMQGIEQKFEEGKIDQEAYDRLMNMVRSEPLWARSQSRILQSLLSEKEQLEVSEPTTEERTDGQSKWQVYSNPNLPNYGQEVPKSRIKMQLTPEQQARLEIERKQEERLAKAAEAKADAPTDSDPKVGKAFLSSINWKADEKGGESDDVSALIRKSTSGGLETFGAGAMRFFDRTTEGMKALSALKTRAADLTLKLLGGKLGSGVSNADREFMQQKTADIGNSSLTAEERLSAWNDLVNRMKTIAGVAPAAPMPGGAGAGAGPQPAATGERQTKSGVKYTVRENP